MSKIDIQVRVANLDDTDLILAFLTQKAEFDRHLNTLTATADELKQTLFRHPSLVTVRLTKIAKAQNCGRIEWTVAVNNTRGIAFYQKQGARILADIKLCRVESAAIAQLASN